MSPRPTRCFIFARSRRGDTIQSSATTAPARLRANVLSDADHAGGAWCASRRQVVVSMSEREGRGGAGSHHSVAGRSAKALAVDGQASLRLARGGGAVCAQEPGDQLQRLLLLTLAVGLIAVRAARAENLARQQMEFVAPCPTSAHAGVGDWRRRRQSRDGVVGDPQRGPQVRRNHARGRRRRL